MSDIAELWSLPWHDLQRRLAAGYAGNGAAQSRGGGLPIGVSGSPYLISPVGCWLLRARTDSAPWAGRPQNNCRITVR